MKTYGPNIGFFGWWHLLLFFHAIFAWEMKLTFDLSVEWPLVATIVFAGSAVAFVGMTLFMAIILMGVSSSVDQAMGKRKSDHA